MTSDVTARCNAAFDRQNDGKYPAIAKAVGRTILSAPARSADQPILFRAASEGRQNCLLHRFRPLTVLHPHTSIQIKQVVAERYSKLYP